MMIGFILRNIVYLIGLALFAFSLRLTGYSVEHPETVARVVRVAEAISLPVERGLNNIILSIQYHWTHYLWLVDSAKELDDAHQRLRILEAQEQRLGELEKENARLRRALNFRILSGHQGLMANVIAFDPVNWSRTVVIDRGAEDGVEIGLAVLDGPAVVGQTIAVDRQTARVLLIDDRISAVPVVVQRSRVLGIAEGRLSRSLKMLYVQIGQDVMVGDKVLTSGLDGVFARGLLVGTVSSIGEEPEGLFREIEIAAASFPGSLEQVQVMLPVPPEEEGSSLDSTDSNAKPTKSD